MRRLIVSLAMVLVNYQVAAGEDTPLAIFSFQDTSCGAWVNSSSNEIVRAQYEQWFRGFVSGYNFGAPGNQVKLGRMPDSTTLGLYIDKYCRDHPLSDFSISAFHLVKERRERPLDSPSGKSGKSK